MVIFRHVYHALSGGFWNFSDFWGFQGKVSGKRGVFFDLFA
jgi:hypothetical protein